MSKCRSQCLGYSEVGEEGESQRRRLGLVCKQRAVRVSIQPVGLAPAALSEVQASERLTQTAGSFLPSPPSRDGPAPGSVPLSSPRLF